MTVNHHSTLVADTELGPKWIRSKSFCKAIHLHYILITEYGLASLTPEDCVDVAVCPSKSSFKGLNIANRHTRWQIIQSISFCQSPG